MGSAPPFDLAEAGVRALAELHRGLVGGVRQRA
jgi:hypothetical protein